MRQGEGMLRVGTGKELSSTQVGVYFLGQGLVIDGGWHGLVHRSSPHGGIVASGVPGRGVSPTRYARGPKVRGVRCQEESVRYQVSRVTEKTSKKKVIPTRGDNNRFRLFWNE